MGEEVPLVQRQDAGHGLQLRRRLREGVDGPGVHLVVNVPEEPERPLGDAGVQPPYATPYRPVQDVVGRPQDPVCVGGHGVQRPGQGEED